jgi:hypothetical protein
MTARLCEGRGVVGGGWLVVERWLMCWCGVFGVVCGFGVFCCFLVLGLWARDKLSYIALIK